MKMKDEEGSNKDEDLGRVPSDEVALVAILDLSPDRDHDLARDLEADQIHQQEIVVQDDHPGADPDLVQDPTVHEEEVAVVAAIGLLKIKLLLMMDTDYTSLIWIVKLPKGIWKNYLGNMDLSRKFGWPDPYLVLLFAYIAIARTLKKPSENQTDQKFAAGAFASPLPDLELEDVAAEDLILV